MHACAVLLFKSSSHAHAHTRHACSTNHLFRHPTFSPSPPSASEYSLDFGVVRVCARARLCATACTDLLGIRSAAINSKQNRCQPLRNHGTLMAQLERAAPRVSSNNTARNYANTHTHTHMRARANNRN